MFYIPLAVAHFSAAIAAAMAGDYTFATAQLAGTAIVSAVALKD